jgi:hypothetical protein
MSELSVMILCGRSPRHLYVANCLSYAARPVAIVHETGGQWTRAKLRQLARPANLWRKGSRWLRDRKRYAGGRESRFFFGEQPPRLERIDLLTEVPHINDRAVSALAERLQPDVIAVFGTSLIRPPLLGMGRLGMVNLHGGLSPEYRGADCTFWALYNGEPHKVGCTLHFIDAGIDTGRLIAHVRPAVYPGDDELSLFWRGVKESAGAYAELLRRLAAGERFGAVQAGKGRLYQVKDRHLNHERRLTVRMRAGHVVTEALPLRIDWFASDPARSEIPAKSNRTAERA